MDDAATRVSAARVGRQCAARLPFPVRRDKSVRGVPPAGIWTACANRQRRENVALDAAAVLPDVFLADVHRVVADRGAPVHRDTNQVDRRVNGVNVQLHPIFFANRDGVRAGEVGDAETVVRAVSI